MLGPDSAPDLKLYKKPETVQRTFAGRFKAQKQFAGLVKCTPFYFGRLMIRHRDTIENLVE
jgi:hypothetical protein